MNLVGVSRALAVLLTALAVAAFPAPAGAREPDPNRFHLALGDSFAYGFQLSKALAGLPPEAFDTGYADLLADRIRRGSRPVTLVNHGCPGESTVTYLAGPCPWTAGGRALHDPFTGSQRDAASAFLGSHRGRVDLVTVSLWGNDANDLVRSCGGDPQCIGEGAPAAIAAVAANLDRILGEIRRVAPDAPVVLIGPADPNSGPAAAVSRPLYRALDSAMAGVAAGQGVGYAALLPVFNPDGDGGAALCTLTLACSEGDLHPSDAGYRAIAEIVEAALTARPGRL